LPCVKGGNKDKRKNMTKTKTKKKTAKAKLEEIKRIDGQDDSAEGAVLKKTPNKVYRSIDELFGFQGSTYKTHEPEEYRASLVGMNTFAIQQEMYRVGLNPTDNRNIMIERLMKQFARTNLALHRPNPIQVKNTPEIRAILSEGANKVR
jgi:hypothetical protein